MLGCWYSASQVQPSSAHWIDGVCHKCQTADRLAVVIPAKTFFSHVIDVGRLGNVRSLLRLLLAISTHSLLILMKSCIIVIALQ
jgi:hypothetical protein